jgi:drug/metabolite transporter (DMT)-like permease
MTPATRTTLAYGALVLTSFLWATTSVVGRAVNESLSPAAIAFWHWGLGVLIVYPSVRAELHQKRDVLRRAWRQLALLGLMSAAPFAAWIYFALHYTTASNVALLNSTIPVWVLLAVWLRHGARPTRRSIAGFVISICGVLAIVLRGDIDNLLGLRVNPGDLMTLAAMVVWGIYSVLLRERPPELSWRAYLVVSGAFGMVVITPLYLFDIARGTAHPHFDWAAGLALGYLLFFRTLLATLTYNHGIDGVGPARAALFVHLVPVFGALLAYVFLGERLFWYHFAGFALVLAGIYVANRRFA